jgi:hypothetical protein
MFQFLFWLLGSGTGTNPELSKSGISGTGTNPELLIGRNFRNRNKPGTFGGPEFPEPE